MKRYYYIIVVAFIVLFNSSQKLFSFIPEGLYITPKFIFSHDGSYAYLKNDGQKGYFNYLGGGLSIGYSIPTINKSSPVRFEFEYMNRNIIGFTNDLTMHTFLGSVYFDINFFVIDEILTDETYRKTLLNEYPPFTIYLGISMGSKINDCFSTKENKIEYKSSVSTLVFGFSGGMTFNVLPYMSIDLGYRYLLDTKADRYHDVLLGLRFKVPKL